MHAIGKYKSLKIINKNFSFKVNPEAPTDFSGKQPSAVMEKHEMYMFFF